MAKGSGTIPPIRISQSVSREQREQLLTTLQNRFQNNPERHPNLDWTHIQAKLETDPKKIVSLYAMESTGGEPDVVDYDEKNDEYHFYDCSPETPSGRRSITYDRPGEAEREKRGVYPAGNAVDLAMTMGIELLTEEQYRLLQQRGQFDTKTSSWIQTPADIRRRGGALFADYRFGHVFVYHNSAPTFYSARGFRGLLRV